MRSIILLTMLFGCEYGIDYRVHPPEPKTWNGIQAPDLENEYQEDDFLNPEVEEQTILVVVDNSVSMGDDQHNLAAYIPSFAEALINSGKKFHFGATTTDCDLYSEWTTDPTECGIVSWMEGSPTHNHNLMVEQIQDLMMVGIEGDSIEQILHPINAALEKRDDENAGFFLDGALHLIAITDEPDQTKGDRKEVAIRNLHKEEDERGTLTFNGIIRTDHEPISYLGGCSAERDQGLNDLVEEFHGLVGNICDPSWAPIFEDIGEQVVGRPTKFYLSKRPKDIIQVVVMPDNQPEILTDIWTYLPKENAIDLSDFPPEYLDRVVVYYEVLF